MPQFFSRLVVDPDQEMPIAETSLWLDDELVFSDPVMDEAQTLNTLVFKICRKPKDLREHLRRIYFCYQKRLSDQLYAALLDFVIVLGGKGQRICQRMIVGSSPHLDDDHILLLKKAVNESHAMKGNRYSAFTRGLLGTGDLVDYRRHAEDEHDFLTLANDYIQYSQLEQAMDVLETGITVDPERQDLQEALLELYKSTRNRTRFESFYKSLSATEVQLIDAWQSTAIYFEGQAR